MGTVLVVGGLAAAAPANLAAQPPDVVNTSPGAVSLVSFNTCDKALSGLRQAAWPYIGPYGFGGPTAVAMEGGGAIADAPMAEDGAARAGAPAPQAPKSASSAEQPGATDQHSSTNNHEVGIDEPDLVKTDGKRLVSAVNGQFKVIDVASHKVTGTLDLPDMTVSQILLAGDRALLVANRSPRYVPLTPEESLPPASSPVPTTSSVPRPPGSTTSSPPPPPLSTSSGPRPPVSSPVPNSTVPPPLTSSFETHPPSSGETKPAPPLVPIDPPIPTSPEQTLVLVDLSGAPRTLGTLAMTNGEYVDARQIGSVARVVLSSRPRLNFVHPNRAQAYSSALDQNREIAARSTINDWLPYFKLNTGDAQTEGTFVSCDRVSHAQAYSGTSMLTVLTVDLTKNLGTGDPVTVVADGNTVYGTDKSLYVADDHRNSVAPMVYSGGKVKGTPDIPVAPQRTQIHRFDITGAGPPRYAGSGEVDGALLNQYSMSEYQGNLRVATTVNQFATRADGQSQSVVTVLARKDNSLDVVGRIDGLGVGERIYAVRFLDAVGYVVTFRQTDPLYTLDLSQPTRPRLVGELKIPGYSAYLHPVGDGKILGVGVDGPMSVQVSLFDVGNPAAPNRAAAYQIQGTSSEVGYDAHAFLYWPARNMVVVPVMGLSRDKAAGGSYALVLRLDSGSITEVGRITHPNGMIRRSLVIGDELWTVSDSGVMANGLGDLAQKAWMPLR
ncbi:beta-propeller domain-containing protein [Actinocrispum wychmicini]|uniref:beta-propeller domain-containing protein n=1 Tax=Actinocrispum wychmicini TaxID=1213861 RepID=UPI001047ECBD|nr:beta-propeller domain-containing protein [Actinocrispum wychmicini]